MTPDEPAITTAESDAAMPAVDGRVPGKRGRATQERLLDATADLLETTAYRDLKVVDIARLAGTSPATYYQYFTAVEDAILVLASRLDALGDGIGQSIRDAAWSGKAGFDAAMDVVDRFLSLWDEQRRVLKVIDLAIAEGDDRFRAVRTRLLNPVTTAFCDVIEDMQKAGRHGAEVNPAAQAAVLISMLAHVAEHIDGLRAWGVPEDDARASLARILYWSLTGRKPPTA